MPASPACLLRRQCHLLGKRLCLVNHDPNGIVLEVGRHAVRPEEPAHAEGSAAVAGGWRGAVLRGKIEAGVRAVNRICSLR